MNGGTTFHFVTDGIHAALERAGDAAKDQDIRLGGGVATIRQYLREGLIDEMHLAISPILLGSGEHLLAGIDASKLAINASNTFPRRMLRMWFSRGGGRLDKGGTDFDTGIVGVIATPTMR
jgi:dihydrofolate reductase